LSPGTSYSFQAGSVDLSNNGPTLNPGPVVHHRCRAGRILRRSRSAKRYPRSRTRPRPSHGRPMRCRTAASIRTSAGALDPERGILGSRNAPQNVLTNLKPATTYFLRASSVDRTGNGPTLSPVAGEQYPSPQRRRTPCPGGPSGAGPVGQPCRRLTWQASTEPRSGWI